MDLGWGKLWLYGIDPFMMLSPESTSAGIKRFSKSPVTAMTLC